MWTAVVIMANPLAQDGSQMLLTKRDHEVQAFSPHRADQPFTVSVRLRCSDRSAKDSQPKILNGLIHFRRKDAITVMDQELIRVIAWNRFAELLSCPLRCRMCGPVRGDTRIPSLSDSSSATRSCPHVGLLTAISAINCWIFFGSRGLPPRDFQRQKS